MSYSASSLRASQRVFRFI